MKIKKKMILYLIILFFIIPILKLSMAGVDRNPPTTVLEVGGPHYVKDGIIWIGGNSVIWLNSTDECFAPNASLDGI